VDEDEVAGGRSDYRVEEIISIFNGVCGGQVLQLVQIGHFGVVDSVSELEDGEEVGRDRVEL
jgi:hypothetical protein